MKSSGACTKEQRVTPPGEAQNITSKRVHIIAGDLVQLGRRLQKAHEEFRLQCHTTAEKLALSQLKAE